MPLGRIYCLEQISHMCLCSGQTEGGEIREIKEESGNMKMEEESQGNHPV